MQQTSKNENLLTIAELSAYLNIKEKTLYAKVEIDEIPHYKIGRLVRFKRSEIESWLERTRTDFKRAPGRLRRTMRATGNIDKIIQKAIDANRHQEYTSGHGKSDQIKGLGKEV